MGVPGSSGEFIEFDGSKYTAIQDKRYFELGGEECGYSRDVFLSYEVESRENYRCGEKTIFQERELTICKRECKSRKGELVFTYRLAGLEWAGQRWLSNKKMTGLSLLGTVVGREGEGWDDQYRSLITEGGKQLKLYPDSMGLIGQNTQMLLEDEEGKGISILGKEVYLSAYEKEDYSGNEYQFRDDPQEEYYDYRGLAVQVMGGLVIVGGVSVATGGIGALLGNTVTAVMGATVVGGSSFVLGLGLTDLAERRISGMDEYVKAALSGSVVGAVTGAAELIPVGGLARAGVDFGARAMGSAGSQMILDGKVEPETMFHEGVLAAVMAMVGRRLRGGEGSVEGVDDGSRVIEGGSGAVGERKLITGEDWNDYSREQYGYDNVNWDTAFSSPNDIANMPSSVARMNPDGLQWYLNQNGIETTPLGQGHLAGVPYENGGGFNAHYNSDYGATYVQYHPGSGHYGEGAYYKVSSRNSFSYMGKASGTQRFNLDGTVMK